MSARATLFSAADLAKFCEVDLKTIHNWVEKNAIPHFRTPGKHLRFKAADVVTFLQGQGFEVPYEVARVAPEKANGHGSAPDLAPVVAVLVKHNLCSAEFAPETIDALAEMLERVLGDIDTTLKGFASELDAARRTLRSVGKAGGA